MKTKEKNSTPVPLAGGAGDDTYIVGNTWWPGPWRARSDAVVEETGADTVKSSIGYTLPDNVENLVLTGYAPFGAGNALDNRITGNGSPIHSAEGNFAEPSKRSTLRLPAFASQQNRFGDGAHTARICEQIGRAHV